jgi:hypothetical protein
MNYRQTAQNTLVPKATLPSKPTWSLFRESPVGQGPTCDASSDEVAEMRGVDIASGYRKLAGGLLELFPEWLRCQRQILRLPPPSLENHYHRVPDSSGPITGHNLLSARKRTT